MNIRGKPTACSETVPGGLDVVSDPVVNGLVVLLSVLDVLVDLGRIVRLAWTVPGAHVDADGEAVRKNLLRSLDVDVLAGSRRGRVEVRVVRSELPAERYARSTSEI